MPAFRPVASVAEYLEAQEQIVRGDADRREAKGMVSPALAGAPAEALSTTGTRSASPQILRVFVVMPFGQSWSGGIYAYVRRAVSRLGAPDESIHVFRADEIAEPGHITEQIKSAIRSSQIVVADITDTNPNVMWELGYADGLGKTIVIINQRPGDSPFDMADRRQVRYSASPTDMDEARSSPALAGRARCR